MNFCKECHETPCMCGEEIPRMTAGCTMCGNSFEGNPFKENICPRCVHEKVLKIPYPVNKDDPIRWDFSQKEIERMMYLLEAIDNYLYRYHEDQLVGFVRQLKDDWQRKIDWNIERGNWK